jgi:predicted acylesterase/phospholipase RssA
MDRRSLLKLLYFFTKICFLVSAKVVNQLSFSGGGSFGAVEIGILKRINERFGKNYDLYTGISAGALNAGFLTYYKNITNGIAEAEKIYSEIDNHAVYKILPKNELSLLNTEPLYKTLTRAIGNMINEPLIHALIGTTNLYTGKLDIYSFEDNDNENKVRLLMASSAIPALFPPIKYNDALYADGGVLNNELLQVERENGDSYLNITYITPYEGYIQDNSPIENMWDMIIRVLMIIKKIIMTRCLL